MSKTQISQATLDANIARVRDQYADMPALRDSILARFGESFEVVASANPPASAPAGAGAQSPSARKVRTDADPAAESGRQTEYNELFFAARLAGKGDAEAGRLAQDELDRRHTPVLTDADVRARFSIPGGEDEDAEPDTRTMAELTADAEAFLNAGAWTAQPAGVSIDRVQAHMKERSRVAARQRFAETQFRAMKGAGVADDIARTMAETTATAAHGPAEANLSD